jgi:hypothetical protein
LKRKSAIKQQILDYLTENPQAEDTVRGIVEWWLLKQDITQTTAEVEAALAELVAKGKLGAWTGADGQVHYCHPRRAARKRPEHN